MPFKPLPVLRDTIDEIEISSPCSVPWEGMRGDDRVRFCGQCRQNVYNVREMSRAEARRLIANREQRVCVRIFRRDDGTVVTADCWSRLRAARRRGLLPFVAMMIIVGCTELLAAGFGIRTLWSAFHRPGMGATTPRPVPEMAAPLAGEPKPQPPYPLPPLMGAPPPPKMIGKTSQKMGEIAAPVGHMAGRVRHKQKP